MRVDDALTAGEKSADVPGSSEGQGKTWCNHGLKDRDSEGGYARMDITSL